MLKLTTHTVSSAAAEILESGSEPFKLALPRVCISVLTPTVSTWRTTTNSLEDYPYGCKYSAKYPHYPANIVISYLTFDYHIFTSDVNYITLLGGIIYTLLKETQ